MALAVLRGPPAEDGLAALTKSPKRFPAWLAWAARYGSYADHAVRDASINGESLPSVPSIAIVIVVIAITTGFAMCPTSR